MNISWLYEAVTDTTVEISHVIYIFYRTIVYTEYSQLCDTLKAMDSAQQFYMSQTFCITGGIVKCRSKMGNFKLCMDPDLCNILAGIPFNRKHLKPARSMKHNLWVLWQPGTRLIGSSQPLYTTSIAPGRNFLCLSYILQCTSTMKSGMNTLNLNAGQLDFPTLSLKPQQACRLCK